jgi:SAM-dependent methyltransferase
VGSPPPAPAPERALKLLSPALRTPRPPLRDGYLDVLGEQDATGPHPGQRLMASRGLPLVYERLWRPLGTRLLMGLRGPDTRGEQRLALGMLDLAGGERVLDVGCGPGNLTRMLAAHVGDGLVVGLDASATMLARAVRDTDAACVAYVRADACALPFPDASFDAVSCFAALYLIERPWRALAELVRVLAPGGRVALLASCGRGPVPAAVTSPLTRALSGVRVFGRDELTGALRARGLGHVEQRVAGLAQFVGACRPA